MKSNKLGLLGAIFAAAMAACSANVCQASTIINFDDVSGPLSGAAVTSYLAGYGISFAGPGQTPFILPYTPDGNPFLTVSAPNYFAVQGTAWKLVFSNTLNSLSFTVPGTGNSSTMAAWSATAFAAGAIQLGQVGNPSTTGPNSSAQTYTFTGPIAFVAFTENVGTAGNYLAFDDLTISSTPLPTALPLFATGLGALGLLGWRRKRKVADAGSPLFTGATVAIVAASLVSFAPAANAVTYTYDLLFDVAPVTITGEIITDCNNCGLTNLNVLSWAFNSSSGASVTSATAGANISFGGSSVLNATPTALNFTIGAFGIMSFNGPIGTMAVQFSTVNNPYPLCSTSNGCEIAILPNGVTDIAYVTENQQVGILVDPSPTPLPAALPLFASGIGALGLLGWRRKRKQAA